MAVYTQVSAEALSTFLQGFDVGELVSAKGIAEGVENSNYLISGYIGIDATMPLGRPLERATTPGEDNIDLADYLVK